MMGVENHHLANPTVKLVASQNHPWGLKVVDRSMRNRMFAKSQSYLATTDSLTTKGKQ